MQRKYQLARPETLEVAERNKAMRESVVQSMVKEFLGIRGTIQMLVR